MQNYDNFPLFLKQIQENPALLDGITITSNGKIRGGTAGGTLITITGSGFNDVSGNIVTIDGSECVVQSATTTEIICQTSAHAGSGYYDIEVNVVGLKTTIRS